MPDFAYIARDLQGQRVTGTVSAGSPREAVASLSAQDLFPLRVELGRRFAARRAPRVRTQLVATTYSQLAALLRSGVPLLRSINVVRRQSTHAGLVQVLDDVYSHVEDGASLADALARHPRTFGEMATSILRAGGEGGFLEEALDRVAVFTEQQHDLKSRVVGALAYPIFLAVVGSTIVGILLVFFVPKFEELFHRLRERGELPAVTDGLLQFSHGLRSWGLVAIGLVAVLLLIARARLATAPAQRWRDMAKLRMPVAGKIYLNLAVARFCRVLGTLLRGGVPILRSLEISSSATGNRVLSAAIQDAAENISEGESLSRPLAECGHFPPAIVEMITVAEEANNLETVLTDIADSLERQTWRRLDLMVRLVEPIMLLVMASIVLVVVIALLLPVMKMSMAI
ncbi:MAG: pilus assembly protein PilC [Planctomycetes bacterium RBG_16_64_10]|nr:MAG: pilus assembly protein PilC [Planctomycetes bacterium RBG_16_64_10]